MPRRRAPRPPPAPIVTTPVAAQALLGFDYLLKQSSRRTTVSLQVKDGQVAVAAPAAVPTAEVHRFVEAKRQWVLAKLQLQRQRDRETAAYRFAAGECLPYLGKAYPLVVGRAPRTQVHLTQAPDTLSVLLGGRSRKPEAEQIQRALQAWYRAQAERILSAKTQVLAERLGVTIADIRWRLTRSKWGHCTRAGVIQYNWLIIQAPEPVIDYLVAHEVSHRVHMNHGPRFWHTVASVCPDYQRQRAWLRDNGHRLGL